jgi:protein-S-isoprenylcysteine O-methyltransferase Ste14
VAEEERKGLETGLLLLKLAVFTLLGPGTIAIWLPLYFLFPELRRQRFEWSLASIAALIPLLLGISGYLWCSLDFAFAGRGTPLIFDPPKKLVARGLYRYVRNPMYVSMLSVVVGMAMLFRSWNYLAYAGAVAIGFHLFVLVYEEPHLKKTKGEPYREYCREVPRWLPRIGTKRNDAV